LELFHNAFQFGNDLVFKFIADIFASELIFLEFLKDIDLLFILFNIFIIFIRILFLLIDQILSQSISLGILLDHIILMRTFQNIVTNHDQFFKLDKIRVILSRLFKIIDRKDLENLIHDIHEIFVFIIHHNNQLALLLQFQLQKLQ